MLRKWNLGDCVCNWTPDYLASKVGSVEVKVHVTTNPRMDFINKNFAYK